MTQHINRLKYYLKRKDGVTLMEMMVAFGVFGVFISIALGGFMQSLRNQRAALVFMEANDAASIIFEDIARQLRTAKINTINISQNALSFTNYQGDPVSYDFNNSAQKTINASISVDGFSALRIDTTTVGAPPRIVLSIRMKITDPSIGNPVYQTLQTTISPRLYYNLRSISI
ncbi:MAG: prepilin-type N-terminal cleavage/methylation domain-containing protein [Patescibacteria group bacterium]|nr:prepilin-type N-terminal cleavage/methylation domain-containing protein [Patescibacteria group bacterium]